MRALVAIFLLLAAVGLAAAEPVTLLNVFDGIYEAILFDKVGERLSSARVVKYKKAYDQLAKARKVGPSGACTLYGAEFACSRRRFADLKMLGEIAEDISEGLSGPNAMPFGNVVLESPLPPPVPYLVLNETLTSKGYPRFTSAGRVKSDDEANVGRQGLSFRPGTPTITAFETAAAADALRNFAWADIQDFTSFAPEAAVLHGAQVTSLLRELSGDLYADTRCVGICPRIVRRQYGARTDYVICFYNRMESVMSPPLRCTTLAFEQGNEAWLRTRHVYQISYHEGTGPEETFRCDTSLNTAASVDKLKEMLDGLHYRVIVRKSRTAVGGSRIIASALGRISDVASNRWEITNLDMSFMDGMSDTPAVKTVIRYTIPTYKLSPTRVKEILIGAVLSPESFDQGQTPPERVARAFEASLQKQIANALPDGRCNSQPEEGAIR